MSTHTIDDHTSINGSSAVDDPRRRSAQRLEPGGTHVGTSAGAGHARISAIATHWAVHDDTARRLLAAAGARPAAVEGVAVYPWEVVWRMEGASYVPPSLYNAYRRPMIKAEALGIGDTADLMRGLVDLGQSQLRARLARIEGAGGPVVRLGPRLRRVRQCDLPALLEMITAPQKVRRGAALSGRTAPNRG